MDERGFVAAIRKGSRGSGPGSAPDRRAAVPPAYDGRLPMMNPVPPEHTGQARRSSLLPGPDGEDRRSGDFPLQFGGPSSRPSASVKGRAVEGDREEQDPQRKNYIEVAMRADPEMQVLIDRRNENVPRLGPDDHQTRRWRRCRRYPSPPTHGVQDWLMRRRRRELEQQERSRFQPRSRIVGPPGVVVKMSEPRWFIAASRPRRLHGLRGALREDQEGRRGLRGDFPLAVEFRTVGDRADLVYVSPGDLWRAPMPNATRLAGRDLRCCRRRRVRLPPPCTGPSCAPRRLTVANSGSVRAARGRRPTALLPAGWRGDHPPGRPRLGVRRARCGGRRLPAGRLACRTACAAGRFKRPSWTAIR